MHLSLLRGYVWHSMERRPDGFGGFWLTCWSEACNSPSSPSPSAYDRRHVRHFCLARSNEIGKRSEAFTPLWTRPLSARIEPLTRPSRYGGRLRTNDAPGWCLYTLMNFRFPF